MKFQFKDYVFEMKALNGVPIARESFETEHPHSPTFDQSCRHRYGDKSVNESEEYCRSSLANQ